VQSLKEYIKMGVNWGVKTGPNLTVLDFDTPEAFADFVVKNINRLPTEAPIVRTGRGYHVWLRSKATIHSQQFQSVDIKGEGGYVVAPPSRHANGTRYTFIRPLNGYIPEVDFNELDFPRLKPPSNQPAAYRKKPRKLGSKSAWELEEGFNWSELEGGVNKGMRHTTLVRYMGWLISQGLPYEQVFDSAQEWNAKNRPPLPEAEFEATVTSCWSQWASGVSIKTLNSYRVLVGTDGCSDSQTKLAQTPRQSAWETEDAIDPVAFCGRKSRIVSKGRRYVSISFFCGRWNCPRCAAHFRGRWVKHLAKTLDSQELHVLFCKQGDWGRIRRGINRLKADYVRINRGDELTVVLNRPHPESRPLAEANLVAYLDSIIPTKASSCPISTSRGWERTKHNEEEYNGYEMVTHTWLSLPDQVSIVEELGGTVNLLCNNRWSSPEDVGVDEWKEQFIEGIRNREREIEEMVEKRYQQALEVINLASTLPKDEVVRMLIEDTERACSDGLYLRFARN